MDASGVCNRKRPFLIFFLCAFFLFMPAVLYAGAGEKPCPDGEKASGDTVLARFGGKAVTLRDFESRTVALPGRYRSRDAVTDLDKKREALESLLQVHLFAQAARDENLDREDAVKRKIDDAVDSILAAEYTKRLYLSRIEAVTDREIEEYYKKHEADFSRPAMVRARHILIRLDPGAKPKEIAAARKKAIEVRKELEKGTDFAEMAKKHSDDRGTKDRGGDLGFVTENRMDPVFSTVLFALEPGELSEPVKARRGFHIIKVETKREGHVLPLAAVNARIRSQIVTERQDEKTAKEYERLKSKYRLKIVEENLDAIKLKKGG